MAELAVLAPAPTAGRRGRFSYGAKIAAGIALVALADQFFFFADEAGATIGLFALFILAALFLTLKPLRRGRSAAVAGGLLFAFALVEDPSLLALALCWVAISLAVLLPRVEAFDNAARWAVRLAAHACRSLLAPLGDARRLSVARRRHGGLRLPAKIPSLWLPFLGTGLFFALFAIANPVIAQALERLDLTALIAALSLTRMGLWLWIAALLWPLFRPRVALLPPARESNPDRLRPGFSLGSVTLSLFAFNDCADGHTRGDLVR